LNLIAEIIVITLLSVCSNRMNNHVALVTWTHN